MNAMNFEAQQNDEMRESCRRIARDGTQGTARRIQQMEAVLNEQRDRIAMLEKQVAVLESGEAVTNLLAINSELEAELHRLRAAAAPAIIVNPVLSEVTY